MEESVGRLASSFNSNLQFNSAWKSPDINKFRSPVVVRNVQITMVRTGDVAQYLQDGVHEASVADVI